MLRSNKYINKKCYEVKLKIKKEIYTFKFIYIHKFNYYSLHFVKIIFYLAEYAH